MQPARMKLHAKEHTNNPVHRPNFRGHALTKGGSSPSTQDSTRDPSPSSLSTKRAKRLVSAPPSDEPSSFGPGSEAGGGMRMPPTSSERWFKDLCRCSLSPSRTMSSVCPSRLPGTLLHTCRVPGPSQRMSHHRTPHVRSNSCVLKGSWPREQSSIPSSYTDNAITR